MFQCRLSSISSPHSRNLWASTWDATPTAGCTAFDARPLRSCRAQERNSLRLYLEIDPRTLPPLATCTTDPGHALVSERSLPLCASSANTPALGYMESEAAIGQPSFVSGGRCSS